MRDVDWKVIDFPVERQSEKRRALRKELLGALRTSGCAVLVDLSRLKLLDHHDIDLLLECAACVAGRDAKLILVAGSPALRALLEVSRIASVVPVFDSTQEAFGYPQISAETIHVPAHVKDPGAHQ